MCSLLISFKKVMSDDEDLGVQVESEDNDDDEPLTVSLTICLRDLYLMFFRLFRVLPSLLLSSLLYADTTGICTGTVAAFQALISAFY
jgi:hypothetical protein